MFPWPVCPFWATEKRYDQKRVLVVPFVGRVMSCANLSTALLPTMLGLTAPETKGWAGLTAKLVMALPLEGRPGNVGGRIVLSAVYVNTLFATAMFVT